MCPTSSSPSPLIAPDRNNSVVEGGKVVGTACGSGPMVSGRVRNTAWNETRAPDSERQIEINNCRDQDEMVIGGSNRYGGNAERRAGRGGVGLGSEIRNPKKRTRRAGVGGRQDFASTRWNTGLEEGTLSGWVRGKGPSRCRRAGILVHGSNCVGGQTKGRLIIRKLTAGGWPK